ncbi:MAG: ATP-binding protein, partial [bacterium]
ELEISIRDTGAGIPEKALPHIFDYFYRHRDENTRRESGTGIGLALTKELVTLHHGEISVTSQEGVGSEFVICLPLGKAHLKPVEIVEEVASRSETEIQISRDDQFSVNSNQSLITKDDDPSLQYSSNPILQQSITPILLVLPCDCRKYRITHHARA